MKNAIQKIFVQVFIVASIVGKLVVRNINAAAMRVEQCATNQLAELRSVAVIVRSARQNLA
jgi:hypothetical protein